LIEKWVSIPGYDDWYEASNLGRIRSMDRYIKTKTGRYIFHEGRVLTPSRWDGGKAKPYWYVTLQLRNGTACGRVHQLVCAAFHGERPSSIMMALHKNDDINDNRSRNLYWGTHADNMKDRARNKRRGK
jgi:hypothetical protein